MTSRRTVSLVFLLLLLSAVVLPAAAADDTWVFVYRAGCGDCKKALPIVEAYRVNNSETPIEMVDLNKGPAAAARFSELQNRSGQRASVPVLFAGSHVVRGSANIRVFLEGGTLAPTPTPRNGTANATPLPPLTPLAVVTAGLVDGINPCAFAVLALLLGTLTVAGTRRRVLMIGAAYTPASSSATSRPASG
jgi:glutaredoxin